MGMQNRLSGRAIQRCQTNPPPGFEAPAPSGWPRWESQIILIGTPAIRIPLNSPNLNDFRFSNRHKTAIPRLEDNNNLRITVLGPTPLTLVGRRTCFTNRRLIGSPVIRICPKPLEINHLNFSNRHEAAYFEPGSIKSPLEAMPSCCVRSGILATNHSPLVTEFLIETSALRNRRNPHRLNDMHFSNRDKTHLFSLFPFRFSPLRPLIGPPVIRIRHKFPEINHLSFSNRHENSNPRCAEQRTAGGSTNHESRATKHRGATNSQRRSLYVTLRAQRRTTIRRPE